MSKELVLEEFRVKRKIIINQGDLSAFSVSVEVYDATKDERVNMLIMEISYMFMTKGVSHPESEIKFLASSLEADIPEIPAESFKEIFKHIRCDYSYMNSKIVREIWKTKVSCEYLKKQKALNYKTEQQDACISACLGRFEETVLGKIYGEGVSNFFSPVYRLVQEDELYTRRYKRLNEIYSQIVVSYIRKIDDLSDLRHILEEKNIKSVFPRTILEPFAEISNMK